MWARGPGTVRGRRPRSCLACEALRERLGQADATLALHQTPNLYIDTAAVYRQDFIEETVEAFGAGRVLFGSGSPYFDQRYEIKRVLLAKVDEVAREAMQAGNARRLLGLTD